MPRAEWLDVAGLAALKGVAKRTALQWIQQGRLPHQRIGRVYAVRRTDAEAFIPPPGRGWAQYHKNKREKETT